MPHERDNRFVGARAVEMHMGIAKGHFYARIYRKKTGIRERSLI